MQAAKAGWQVSNIYRQRISPTAMMVNESYESIGIHVEYGGEYQLVTTHSDLKDVKCQFSPLTLVIG